MSKIKLNNPVRAAGANTARPGRHASGICSSWAAVSREPRATTAATFLLTGLVAPLETIDCDPNTQNQEQSVERIHHKTDEQIRQ